MPAIASHRVTNCNYSKETLVLSIHTGTCYLTSDVLLQNFMD